MADKAKIFIDGEHGTTGLQIRQRLAERSDIEVLSMPEDKRRDPDYRAARLAEADIAILCLPDDASREAVAMLEKAGNTHTRVIDTSTAHRTADGWVFGFAEITRGQREAIAKADRVSNPGCWSTGAIALLRPLIERQVLGPAYPVTVNGISGYTGGGKGLIAQMENEDADDHITANNFLYALTLAHKHVPEIMTRAGLTRRPIFTPNVGRFRQGMIVNVPLHLDLVNGTPDQNAVHAILSEHYAGQNIVEVVSPEVARQMPRVDAEEMTGTDRMRLYVFGNAEATGQVNLVATLDNLGKGASGAAVQNMDLMLGRD
ncbi:MAG: N-acetyl-gamma-glutamyl-phosphate reductase [Salaquimonas sp.]|jgi:N-acetyl-gamma-glutamyl-phosphate reductase|nr:N-acetyl-gamma-glutamyl-phosphate reductase [Salaquimonas sp.]